MGFSISISFDPYPVISFLLHEPIYSFTSTVRAFEFRFCPGIQRRTFHHLHRFMFIDCMHSINQIFNAIFASLNEAAGVGDGEIV